MVGSRAQDIEAAGLIESFGGDVFARVQKMTCRLPYFVLLLGVHSRCWVPLLVVPDGFYLHEDDCFPFAGNDVKLSTAVGVVAGEDFVAFALQVFCSKRFDVIAFGLVLLLACCCPVCAILCAVRRVVHVSSFLKRRNVRISHVPQ